MGSSRDTFATSECRKWAIAPPDLCSPIRAVCLLVFRRATFVHELWSGTRKPSPMLDLKASLSGTKDGFFCIKKEEKLAMRPDTWPQPTQLPEDHWLLVQKEEEELAIRPVSPWDIPLLRGCAETHTVLSIQKRRQDLFSQRQHQIRHHPIACRCCFASTKPRASFRNDLQSTLGLCPGPQLGL